MTENKGNKKGAVALQYDRDRDDAPKVAATGRGDTAQRILAEAEKHDIPIRQDPDLLEVLSQIPQGEEIPPELYQAVAEILAFVYRVNERYQRG
ncbi:MAG: EscU/YscU/HrcU family type III secretion system export apparatus switch protein [Desulfohalobiaceae bacterium]|nr:EscU/YscU/HrcU family type III secretion system export apparatus switch protein [Desulfohalobiaceae bacterium]MCF8085425.1 EscU/YscU/HrcU family type III secretion system export apparatus switch protein [Desulfohalobiaceae bacterium]